MADMLKVLFTAVVYLACSSAAYSARLKDIADIEGVRGNQLYGYGVVIGSTVTEQGLVRVK